MNNRKSIWKKALLDSVMIIFSVLVALFINEWRNHYNERVKTNKILENIEGEIKVNQTFLLELIVYHEIVSAKIEQAFHQDSMVQNFFPSIHFELFKVAPKGIIQGKLNTIAWTVAKTDKITNRISLMESQTLFAVYEQQITINETIDRIINFLSSREIQRKNLLKESVLVLGMEMHELIGQEKNLRDKCAHALKMLEERKK